MKSKTSIISKAVDYFFGFDSSIYKPAYYLVREFGINQDCKKSCSNIKGMYINEMITKSLLSMFDASLLWVAYKTENPFYLSPIIFSEYLRSQIHHAQICFKNRILSEITSLKNELKHQSLEEICELSDLRKEEEKLGYSLDKYQDDE